jgi:hypothetical protein
VTAGVGSVIDTWRKEKGYPGALPVVDDLGPGSTFLQALTAKTTDEEIIAATSCPNDIDQNLKDQVDEVAWLRTTDPAKEKQRLISKADALDLVTEHLSSLDRSFGNAVHQKLAGLRDRSKLAQAAADAASRTTFGNEPLAGIGSPVWKALWQAAERYSLTVYSDHGFPHTGDGAVCVLCQQSLDGGARRD